MTSASVDAGQTSKDCLGWVKWHHRPGTNDIQTYRRRRQSRYTRRPTTSRCRQRCPLFHAIPPTPPHAKRGIGIGQAPTLARFPTANLCQCPTRLWLCCSPARWRISLSRRKGISFQTPLPSADMCTALACYSSQTVDVVRRCAHSDPDQGRSLPCARRSCRV